MKNYLKHYLRKLTTVVLLLATAFSAVFTASAASVPSLAVPDSFPVLVSTDTNAASAPVKKFSDVPANSYAFASVQRMRTLGITDGLGNNKFGYGKSINRGDFLIWLTRLLKYEKVNPAKGSYTDLQNRNSNYYIPVETALKAGIIIKGTEPATIKPLAIMTREEAVVMLIRSLGLDSTAKKYEKLEIPFTDVTANNGYILLAKDFGLLSGIGAKFNPSAPLTREFAADLLIRLYNKLQTPLKELHAFYAIQSFPQRDKISKLNSVGFGWSSLNFDTTTQSVVLDTSRNTYGLNDYYLPEGFSTQLAATATAGAISSLMVYGAQSKLVDPDGDGVKTGLPEYILLNPPIYRKLIEDIASALNQSSRGTETGSFNGVTIDFEGMKGEPLKNAFNSFLSELKTRLDQDGKKLYVAVPPSKYYTGYDFRTIGNIADRVILMAHDYNAVKLTDSEMARGYDNTPITPVNEIYYALKTATDSKTGIVDRKKLWLQISFEWVTWNKKDGKTINSVPASFSMENFFKLFSKNPAVSFPPDVRNPKLAVSDPATGINSTVWYEDSRSVMDKIRLAKLFGLQGISLWRLGNIPDDATDLGMKYNQDIWQKILLEAGR